MNFIPVRTRRVLPPKDDIYDILAKLPRLRNGDILFITSKILAVHQGRCVPTGSISKNKLIRREAERILPGGKDFVLTINNSTLIPSAGIDESNGNGYYTLWPKNVQKLLKEIRTYLLKENRIKKLGVVATDSHTTPLRYGVMGIATGAVGFEPLADYRGRKDLFGRTLRHTKANTVDTLSAMAVLLMGESNERTPICILRGAKSIRFTNRPTWRNLTIPLKKDLYYPMLKHLKRS